MIRIGDIVVGHLDIEAGRFTYGNRIALIDIFTDKTRSEYQKIKAAFRELYGYSCLWLITGHRIKALTRLIEQLSVWFEKEQRFLNYRPTADELAAGINEYARKVGSMATVKAIAKSYSRDPDEVLKWDYAKVFGILFTDLEEYKFNERLTKQLNDKRRRYN